jgi:hypothetical protein
MIASRKVLGEKEATEKLKEERQQQLLQLNQQQRMLEAQARQIRSAPLSHQLALPAPETDFKSLEGPALDQKAHIPYVQVVADQAMNVDNINYLV